ncbi:hypothetical protein O181_033594 [Austropuccinia psidii MF-1]|uniref:Uncharacterized protein n=1 Tax=Austropuccinia psidii MF-1 TaxID=1389203 RepID=A0A9Q3CZG4_9BASI|nr:hypothetical protein [Austropuccinia psidii MF-1]
MKAYLQIKGFLCQENTIELLGGWSPLSFKDKVKKIKNWLKKQIILSKEGTANDPSFGERRTSSVNKLQTISRKNPKTRARTSEETEVLGTIEARENKRKIGTGVPN